MFFQASYQNHVPKAHVTKVQMSEWKKGDKVKNFLSRLKNKITRFAKEKCSFTNQYFSIPQAVFMILY